MGTQLYRSEGPACVGEGAIVVGGCPTAAGRGMIQAVRSNDEYLATRRSNTRLTSTHPSSRRLHAFTECQHLPVNTLR